MKLLLTTNDTNCSNGMIIRELCEIRCSQSLLNSVSSVVKTISLA